MPRYHRDEATAHRTLDQYVAAGGTGLMQRPSVTAPVIGARRCAQLVDNPAAADRPLDDERVQRLTKLNYRSLPYPSGLLSRFAERLSDPG